VLVGLRRWSAVPPGSGGLPPAVPTAFHGIGREEPVIEHFDVVVAEPSESDPPEGGDDVVVHVALVTAEVLVASGSFLPGSHRPLN
jgi:hypothetical protein